MEIRHTSRGARALFVAAGVAVLAALGSPASAETLRTAIQNSPPNFGDPTVSLSFTHSYTFEALYDALTIVDGDGRPIAALAASWTNIDPLTWRFQLQPNIKFHAGTPFNAAAIVAAVHNLQSADQQKYGASVYGSLKHIVDATAVDDLTVDVKTSRPEPILPNVIAALRIVDPVAWADLGRVEFGKAPSGTGPFQAAAWDNTRVELTSFDGGVRVPKVDGVVMYFMPEPTTRVQAFQSDAVDIAFGVATDSVELIEAAGGTVHAGRAPSVAILVFNQSMGGFTTDVRVRQAFNYAIDNSYTETLLGGYARAGSQPAASSVNGFQSDIQPYPYDPAKARQLLADAGFPNGLKTVVEIVDTNADLTNVFQQVAQDVSKVGIDLELKLITLPDLFGRVTGSKEFEAPMHVMNYGSNPSIDMMRSINAFHSCAAKQGWTCIPEAEEAIAGANTEFDPVKRAAHLRKIAQLYHDAAPHIFLYEQFELDATSSRVHNFRNDNWRIYWADIELR